VRLPCVPFSVELLLVPELSLPASRRSANGPQSLVADLVSEDVQLLKDSLVEQTAERGTRLAIKVRRPFKESQNCFQQRRPRQQTGRPASAGNHGSRFVPTPQRDGRRRCSGRCP
jgi:hypothetical protein